MDTIIEPVEIIEIIEPVEPAIKKKRVRNTSAEDQRRHYLKWRASHLEQSLANSKHCYQLLKARKNQQKLNEEPLGKT